MKKKTSNKAVYVIDDNPVVCKLMSSIKTKRNDIDVIAIQNADTAFRELNHIVPDLVFLDYYLDEFGENGTHGDIILKFLKETVPDIPVVLLTNLREKGKINELLKIGFDGFIHKSESNMMESVMLCIQKYIETDSSES